MLLSAKKNAKKLIIGFMRYAKNGFRKKNSKNKIIFAPAPLFARMPESRESLPHCLLSPSSVSHSPVLHLALLSENDASGIVMLVGAYLCYGLKSQSPTDRHLYACVGMDCNPRVQGTHSFLQ